MLPIEPTLYLPSLEFGQGFQYVHLLLRRLYLLLGFTEEITRLYGLALLGVTVDVYEDGGDEAEAEVGGIVLQVLTLDESVELPRGQPPEVVLR
jgi:hypothetical protein